MAAPKSMKILAFRGCFTTVKLSSRRNWNWPMHQAHQDGVWSKAQGGFALNWTGEGCGMQPTVQGDVLLRS